MSIQENLISDRKRLDNEISKLSKRHSSLPPGYLRIIRNQQGRNIYFHCFQDATGVYHSKYIPQKNQQLRNLLFEKEYIKRRLAELQREQKAITEYLDATSGNLKSRDFIENDDTIKEVLKSVLFPDFKEAHEIFNQNYHRKSDHPEALVIPTVIPELNVRSKAEADIISRLVHFHIPFHYEELLQVNDIFIAPDFKCLNVHTGKAYWWEHQGRWDDPSYVNNNVFRRDPKLYQAGLIPWKNLIITTETKNDPLDIRWVDELIKYYLL